MAEPNPAFPATGASFDLIVVGGGTIGLSAAYYAASRGLKTLLLEQSGELADAHASSGGYSRMFRIMYSPSCMAQLAEIALALWSEIETASGSVILKKQPLIFYGLSESGVEGDLGSMKDILAALGAAYRWYGTGAALAAAYKAFKTVPDDYVGLVQPNSAVIRTKDSVAAFRLLAERAGALLLTGQPAAVTKVSPRGPYEVTCPAGSYATKSLVLAPSAWTNRLLEPFGMQMKLVIWQMTVAYFRAQVEQYEYPLWYEFGPAMPNPRRRMHLSRGTSAGHTPAPTTYDLLYGFPPDEMPGHLKVSADFTHDIYTDPRQCTNKPDPVILGQIGAFLQQRFNGVHPEPADTATCLYTMSNDFQMVLDRVPGHANAAIFTGDSGRGFKFTPLFGRILVDLATTGSTYYDIAPFAITRPGILGPS